MNRVRTGQELLQFEAGIGERHFFGSNGVQIKELDQEVHVGRHKELGTVGDRWYKGFHLIRILALYSVPPC